MSKGHAHADADDAPSPAETEAAAKPAPKVSLEDRVTALEQTVARIVPIIGEEPAPPTPQPPPVTK